MSLDDKTWKEYLKAKKVIDSVEDKEKLDRKIEQYEKHKKYVLAKHYEAIQKGGDAYLEKLSKRRKELYHLRKAKKLKEKEDKQALEIARGERVKNCGNPFGMAIHNLKIESDNSGSETETDCGTDIYCSTCPTTDCESVISEKPRKKEKPKEIEAPPPPKSVQNLFRKPIWS